MDWWILEIITVVALIAVVVVLGPLIKRFGRGYAADVFRANPSTGKSFIVLTDVAYYLIFLSFILFTVTFDLPSDWDGVVNGVQLKHEVSRIAGIVLFMGLLHGFNILGLAAPVFWLGMLALITASALLAWSHGRDFYAWYRERDVASARLEAAIARSRYQTLCVQLSQTGDKWEAVSAEVC